LQCGTQIGYHISLWIADGIISRCYFKQE